MTHDIAGSMDREHFARRGKVLSWIALVYNAAEGLAAIISGVMAGSIALVGFGIDSVIELVSSSASLWRLERDPDPAHRARAERLALNVIGACFLALAAYVAVDAAHALLTGERPDRSIPGVIITILSVLIMPQLARAKKKVAVALGSRALIADAAQTSLCAYLSLIVLIGLLLNAVLGWWWADPVAALAMVPIIAKEGVEGLRGDASCDDCR